MCHTVDRELQVLVTVVVVSLSMVELFLDPLIEVAADRIVYVGDRENLIEEVLVVFICLLLREEWLLLLDRLLRVLWRINYRIALDDDKFDDDLEESDDSMDEEGSMDGMDGFIEYLSF